MNLNPIKANMTELDLCDGRKVLFSYRTPVALKDYTGMNYKTSYKWSATTTRHINQWFKGITALEKPQDFFDSLIQEVK
jgi:hypothetical protein